MWTVMFVTIHYLTSLLSCARQNSTFGSTKLAPLQMRFIRSAGFFFTQLLRQVEQFLSWVYSIYDNEAFCSHDILVKHCYRESIQLYGSTKITCLAHKLSRRHPVECALHHEGSQMMRPSQRSCPGAHHPDHPEEWQSLAR